MLFVQSGKKNVGCLFNLGKRTLVVFSIRGKELALFVNSREKNLGCSLIHGKRTWVVRSIMGIELGSFIQSGKKNLYCLFNLTIFFPITSMASVRQDLQGIFFPILLILGHPLLGTSENHSSLLLISLRHLTESGIRLC